VGTRAAKNATVSTLKLASEMDTRVLALSALIKSATWWFHRESSENCLIKNTIPSIESSYFRLTLRQISTLNGAQESLARE